MPDAESTEIRLRIVIDDPVRGVLHSLQDAKSRPVDPKASRDGGALAFEFPVRLADGPRFLGDFVRREGPQRRFVYVAIGTSAGDASSCWTRRMKIDIHDLAPALLEKARRGKLLEVVIAGTAKDGTPACATVKPAKPWRAVAR